jgi:hypothetical protein
MAFALNNDVLSNTERDAQFDAYSAYCTAIGRTI